MRKSAAVLSDKIVLPLMKRYAEGLCLRRLSKVTGINVNTLSREFRARNPAYVSRSKIFARDRRVAFADYVEGCTLRQIAKRHGGIPSTWCARFKKMHPDYATLAREGVFASTSNYLASKKAKRFPAQAEGVRAWLIDNAQELLSAESQSDRTTLSNARENSLSRAEVGRACDYRLNMIGDAGNGIEVTSWQEQPQRWKVKEVKRTKSQPKRLTVV